MRIRIFYDDVNYRLRGWRKIRDLIEEVISGENKVRGDLNFIITTDQTVLEINRKFLNHDYFTDVVSFDYGKSPIISGEVYISSERVKENAREYEVNCRDELIRVMIHGVLHLCGYRDKRKKEIEKMREREKYWMNIYRRRKNEV